MQIVVFSDVHANLPALEEVLKGIAWQQPDAVYCLGDLVNQNVWNNEVVELIRKKNIPVVRGNHDEGIAAGKKKFPFSYASVESKKWGLEAIAYTLKTITNENRIFLSSLPVMRKLHLKNKKGEVLTIVFSHGSPNANTELLSRFTDEEKYIGLMKDFDADIMITGNTHCPYHRSFITEVNGKEKFLHALNPGSVGKPRDGDWRSCYAMITVDENKSFSNKDAVTVDFYRVQYDLGKAVKAIKNSPLPVYFGGCLITG